MSTHWTAVYFGGVITGAGGMTDALRAQARSFRAGIARALTCRVSAGFPRTAG